MVGDEAIDGDIVDERPAVPDADAGVDTPDDLAEAAVSLRELARPALKGIAIGALVAAAVLLVYGTVVSTLIFQQRQDHLASAAKVPTPSLAFGDASLTLQVPELGINLTAIDGVTVDHLRGGPAREPTGALPGDAGVMLVYGHRSAYGAPFEHLDRLQPGSAVYTQARNGPAIKYQVTDILRHTSVSSWDAPADAKDLSYLLLVTSEGGWFQHDQLVVVAKSLPVGTSPARVAVLTTGDMHGRAWLAHLLAFIVAMFATAGTLWFLRDRAGSGVRLAVVTPMVALAVVELLMALDSFLPLVR